MHGLPYPSDNNINNQKSKQTQTSLDIRTRQEGWGEMHDFELGSNFETRTVH